MSSRNLLKFVSLRFIANNPVRTLISSNPHVMYSSENERDVFSMMYQKQSDEKFKNYELSDPEIYTDRNDYFRQKVASPLVYIGFEECYDLLDSMDGELITDEQFSAALERILNSESLENPIENAVKFYKKVVENGIHRKEDRDLLIRPIVHKAALLPDASFDSIWKLFSQLSIIEPLDLSGKENKIRHNLHSTTLWEIIKFTNFLQDRSEKKRCLQIVKNFIDSNASPVQADCLNGAWFLFENKVLTFTDFLLVSGKTLYPAHLKYLMENCSSVMNKKFNATQIRKLFTTFFTHNNATFSSSLGVCNKLIDIGVMSNRRIFLEVAAKFLLEKEPYDVAFSKWSSVCSIDNIIAGGDIFFDYILSDKKCPVKLQERRIAQLVKLYEDVRTPSEGIAQLIVSLVTTGRKMDANVLWSKLDVDCNHFLWPIRKLANREFVDVNLVHISEFADLLAECVLKEMNKTKPLRKKNKGDETLLEQNDVGDQLAIETKNSKHGEEKPTREENMQFLLKRWQVNKRRKYTKYSTKKFHVKADQLEFLIVAIQEVWIRLAEFKNDPRKADLRDIERFLSNNKIPLAEKLHDRVARLKSTPV